MGKQRLLSENWNRTDSYSDLVSTRISPASIIYQYSGGDVIELILGIRLKIDVPEDIRIIFKAVQIKFLQGYYRYELYHCAASDMVQIAEAALKRKCCSLGANLTNTANINSMIAFLKEQHQLTVDLETDLEWLLLYSKKISNSQSSSIHSPNAVIQMIRFIVEVINGLFNREQSVRDTKVSHNRITEPDIRYYSLSLYNY